MPNQEKLRKGNNVFSVSKMKIKNLLIFEKSKFML